MAPHTPSAALAVPRRGPPGLGGFEGEPTSLGGLGGSHAGDMQCGSWTQVSQISHAQRCHRTHRCITQVSHTYQAHTHTFITHRIPEECEWGVPSGDDPAQPLPRQEQVTLVQVGWDVSMEGNAAPSPWQLSYGLAFQR